MVGGVTISWTPGNWAAARGAHPNTTSSMIYAAVLKRNRYIPIPSPGQGAVRV